MALVRGIDWEGDRHVARRLCQLAGTAVRLWLAGDSLVSSAYSETSATNTALAYGIARQWKLSRWGGYVLPSGGQSGDQYNALSTFVAPTNGALTFWNWFSSSRQLTPADLGNDLIPCPFAYVDFSGDAANDSSMIRHWLDSANVAARYFGGSAAWLADGDWIARLIYLRSPIGATVQQQAMRPFETDIETQGAVNTSGALGITHSDMAMPTADGTNTSPGMRVRTTNTGTNETGTSFVPVATRLYRSAEDGFELFPAGIGGATPQQHAAANAAAGGHYTDAALQQTIACTKSTDYWLMAGANGGLNPNKAAYKGHMEAFRARYMSSAIAAGIAAPHVLLTQPFSISTLSDADSQIMFEANAEIAEEQPRTLALNMLRICGDTSGLLVNEGGNFVHPTREGSDAFALAVWNALWEIATGSDAPVGGFQRKRLLKMGVIS